MLLLGLLLVPAVFALCPQGTVYNADFRKCYAYIPKYGSAIEGEGYCINELGGHLVTIQGAAENNYVVSLLNGVNVWIGLNNLTSQWTWTAGQSAYRNYAPGQPSNEEAKFTSINPMDRMWRKDVFSARRHFVCQVDPNEVDLCAGTSCQEGYIQYKGNCKCYKFDATKRFRNDSVAFCASESAHLVKIDTFSLNAFLLANCQIPTAFGLYDIYDPWIALSCPQVDQCHWTTDNSPVSGYQYFYHGLDPILGAAGAMETYMASDDGKWVVSTIDFYKFAVICEKDAVKTGGNRAKFQQKN